MSSSSSFAVFNSAGALAIEKAKVVSAKTPKQRERREEGAAYMEGWGKIVQVRRRMGNEQVALWNSQEGPAGGLECE